LDIIHQFIDDVSSSAFSCDNTYGLQLSCRKMSIQLCLHFLKLLFQFCISWHVAWKLIPHILPENNTMLITIVFYSHVSSPVCRLLVRLVHWSKAILYKEIYRSRPI